MRNAEKANNLQERIVKLIENITYKTFIYTSRGLFEKDKLIFICQMTIQVNIAIMNCIIKFEYTFNQFSFHRTMC